MSHIGTGNGEAIVSTVAAVGFHGLSSFRYHKMNRIGLPSIIAWLWQGFGKEICAAVKIGDKMGNGRKERGFADKKDVKSSVCKDRPFNRTRRLPEFGKSAIDRTGLCV